jgi:hypothetical protein
MRGATSTAPWARLQAFCRHGGNVSHGIARGIAFEKEFWRVIANWILWGVRKDGLDALSDHDLAGRERRA